jgi:hypothetical protein
MDVRPLAVAVLLATSLAACHHEPVINTGERPAGVGGTISGNVRSSGGTALGARKVTAVNTASGARFEQSTAANGGYTMQVPAGTYRLEVELRAGEAVATQPDPTEVNVGDLDGQRDFVLTVR